MYPNHVLLLQFALGLIQSLIGRSVRIFQWPIRMHVFFVLFDMLQVREFLPFQKQEKE